MTVLHSKLQAPKRYDILHRERLTKQFKDICQKKLMILTAGAGYGKTTLVMDALTKSDLPAIWYRLDEQDTDFPVFVSYLYSAIQKPVPKNRLKKQTEALLEWLSISQKIFTRQTVLVFDDYHLVQGSSQINQAIEFILERLPDNIHIIIIGRKNPGLKLSALRVKEQLIEINENELAFTADEIKYFFAKPGTLNDTHIKDIHSSTGGWAASLVLLKYTLDRKTPESLSEDLKLFLQNPEYVFSYLKETIFDAQPDNVKTFMMKAALLPEIDSHLCNTVFNMDNAHTLLNQMIEDHLMIYPVDESGTLFYFHHLFRDFLITRLKKRFSPDQIRQLHKRIAQKIETKNIFWALHHFIESHSFDDAIRLIETHEMKFLIEGKINFLSNCLKNIPESIIENHPQLLLSQAKLLTHFGYPRQALEKLTRALVLFKKQGSKEKMVTCLTELGIQYYFTGHLKEAKLLLEQILDDIDIQSSTYIMAMTFLTFLSSVLGEFETSQAHDRSAREEIETFPEFERKISTALIDTSYSHTLYFQGDFELSEQFNAKLLNSILKLNIDQCLPLAYYQISATSFYVTDFKKGYEAGQKGIEICEKLSLLDSRKAWNYIALAQNCIGLGKLEQATEFINWAMELSEEPGNRWAMANALECQHLIYLAQEKYEPALQAIHRAMDIIDGYGLLPTQGMLENSLANLLIIDKNYATALDILNNARTKLNGIKYHLFNNHLLSAKAFILLNKRQPATDHLSKALTMAQKNTYDRFIIKEKNWLLPFLNNPDLKHPWLKKLPAPYIKRLFKDDLVQKSPGLSITLLGQFKLTIGHRTVSLSEWKSSKALIILKYLAANRHKGFIPREVLIEMLWPEEDMQKTASRFNMAMSALRKTLEPDLSPKAPSLYIERKKDRYALYRDERIHIDTETFVNAITAVQKETIPDKILSACLFAQTVYKGDFLEEDLYEEWCGLQREQFKNAHIKNLKKIIALYENKKEFETAIFYTQKLLNSDPFNENAFKKLMIFYAQTGNLDQIKKTFTNYKNMIRQIDCPVNEKINDLYHSLISI